jgi:hypothetical protein
LRCLDALAADQTRFARTLPKRDRLECRSQSARSERGIWQRQIGEANFTRGITAWNGG